MVPEVTFLPPKGGGTMKTESFFYLFKKLKKLEMIFFGCNVFFIQGIQSRAVRSTGPRTWRT